ncbi:MAG TPA: hypothetical protein VGB97_02205 [Candidatus Paceibacterota bacterium]|jgi:phage host-nuclease inhibitor protein Gam
MQDDILDPMKALEAKIDQLSETLKGSIENLKGSVGTLEGSIEDLRKTMTAEFVLTREEIDSLARSTAEEFSTTRQDINAFRDSVQKEFETTRGDFAIAIDKQVGTFHQHFDPLAARIKTLELEAQKGT